MKTLFRVLKKAFGIVLGLAVLVLVVAWMSGAFRSKTPPGMIAFEGETAPKGAAAAIVERVEQPVFEEAAGSVVAARRTDISSRIMAAIKAVNVHAGDRVKEGDVLVILDERDLRSRVEQAANALDAAKAQAAVAESEYRRRANLQTSVISQSEKEQARKAAEVADADVERAKRAVDEAQVALTYSEIRSPTSGRVVDRLAEPGDTASPGRALLQVYDPSTLQLEAGVRETLASRLKVGDTVNVRIDALASTATAAGGAEGKARQAGEVVEGRIAEIVPQSEAGSRVFRVKVGLPQDPRLYTGMFGRLIIPTGRRAMTLIPESAIAAIGQNRFVSTVGEDKRVTRRLVTVGAPMGGGMIEVLSGLEPGERICLSR